MLRGQVAELAQVSVHFQLPFRTMSHDRIPIDLLLFACENFMPQAVDISIFGNVLNRRGMGSGSFDRMGVENEDNAYCIET